MRIAAVCIVAVAACQRAQPIELPAATGGVAIDASWKHTMSVAADGRVTIDGVSYDEDADAEVHAKLGVLQRSMHNDEAVAARVGKLYVIDEPFVVRIDRAATFEEARYWLEQVRSNYQMYRTRLAFSDVASSAERYVAIDTLPPSDFACGDPNSALLPATTTPFVRLTLLEAVQRLNDKGPAPTPSWFVAPMDVPNGARELGSWTEARDMIARTPAAERRFVIIAKLPRPTSWQEVLPVIVDASASFGAEIFF